MKILVTGGTYGLGNDVKEHLIANGHTVYVLGSMDSYSHHLPNIINDYDVFINNEYRDRIQTKLFEDVYSEWKYKPKTIVNILTSGLIFGSPNKKYMDDKRDLEQKTFQLRTDDKEVRIINVYPHTLESTKLAKNQKLNFSDVSSVIKYLIELPQDIEIFQIGICKTKLKIDSSII